MSTKNKAKKMDPMYALVIVEGPIISTLLINQTKKANIAVA